MPPAKPVYEVLVQVIPCIGSRTDGPIAQHRRDHAFGGMANDEDQDPVAAYP